MDAPAGSVVSITDVQGDLFADSLDLLELQLDFEDQFGFAFNSDGEFAKLRTIGDITDYIAERLGVNES